MLTASDAVKEPHDQSRKDAVQAFSCGDVASRDTRTAPAAIKSSLTSVAVTEWKLLSLQASNLT